MKIPNGVITSVPGVLSLARIVSEDSQRAEAVHDGWAKSSKDS